MSTLSRKLAGIVLPIDKYGSHLNSQGEVIDPVLAKKNFRYAGEALCDLWNRDPIFGRPVITKYTDQKASPFDDVTFPESNDNDNDEPTVPWKWLENHTRMCQYSIDIRKCADIRCCTPKRCKDAADLLAVNNGFLPPVIKGSDGHYLNSFHVLEFYSIDKLPGYDMHCPSLTNYSSLCCSICGAYFPTGSMVTLHMRNQHPKRRGRPSKK